ncbi:MAG: 50S ribosomal protein L4 [Candidatus Moranbacteria bacterium RIFCSPHIGHO2_01_FULL_54_31]|nr:MAG: 50S ribosomal protein L4 [Candidatus Moranbacteria bacterium RIFCSPHIGHO2_01_FULL_54_31]
MAKVTVKNIAGKDVKEIELQDFVFDVPANDTLLHQIYVIQTGNQRTAIAHTKDRSERAGSGIKPWRQKGTGRARAGAVRSPIWRKGGVTFGPTKDRNFTRDTNQKMRQKAVMIALSEKLRSGKMIVIDELRYPEHKTKLFAETLNVLGIAGKSLIVSLTGDERACTVMSRNIPKVENTLTENINVMQLLDREYLIVTEAGIKNLEGRFAAWDKKTAPAK